MTNTIRIEKMVIVFLLAFLIFSPFIIFADTSTCVEGQLCNPIKVGSLPALIKTILEGVIKIGIPIIALAIVYSGFLFVFARGNSEKLKTAKNALMYTLIGAAVLLGSWAIAQVISETVLAL